MENWKGLREYFETAGPVVKERARDNFISLIALINSEHVKLVKRGRAIGDCKGIIYFLREDGEKTPFKISQRVFRELEQINKITRLSKRKILNLILTEIKG